MRDIIFFKRIPVGFLGTNCYIISGDNKNAVVIDPGADFDKLKAALETNGLTAAAALLTHGHFDHHRAAKKFQETGVKIYLHRADEGLISYAPRTITPILFTPDVYIQDGQVLELAGLDIRVIHTPGHTAGGVCYYVGGLLFSGDTLFHGDTGRTDLRGGSFAQIKDSVVNRLFVLPDETKVYPGHEEETTIGEEKQWNTIML